MDVVCYMELFNQATDQWMNRFAGGWAGGDVGVQKPIALSSDGRIYASPSLERALP